MSNLRFHIETAPGYGASQGIMPRFYLQMTELCSFLNVPPHVTEIPSKIQKLIIPELANLYDVYNNLQSAIKEFIKGVQDGAFYKINQDGSTTFIRHKEFEIENLTKDFFIRGKILLIKFFNCAIIADGNFKIKDYFFCDDEKFIKKVANYSSSKSPKFLPLLDVLKTARLDFLSDFNSIRGTIEHEHFELDRFKVIHEEGKIVLVEPVLQNDVLSNKIKFYYENILNLIEKITAYFAGIICEELNFAYRLYVATEPDFPKLMYRYRYRIMEMPFVFETIRCDYK